MPHQSRNVAVILDTAKNYDRRMIAGIVAYAQEQHNWSLYFKEKMVQKLPRNPSPIPLIAEKVCARTSLMRPISPRWSRRA